MAARGRKVGRTWSFGCIGGPIYIFERFTKRPASASPRHLAGRAAQPLLCCNPELGSWWGVQEGVVFGSAGVFGRISSSLLAGAAVCR